MIILFSHQVFQSEGNADGVGGDGNDGRFIAGSGGGAGWRGGGGGSDKTSDSESYKCVGNSGSSYVSGYYACTTSQYMTFSDIAMSGGQNEGNGKVIIESVFLCSDGCTSCTAANVCTKCYSNYFLYKNENKATCVKNCPDGFIGFPGYPECQPCKLPCAKCITDQTTCTGCIDGYHLLNNTCYKVCTVTWVGINGFCQKCDDNCHSCSETQKKCNSCRDGDFLDVDKCVNECPFGKTPIDNNYPNNVCIDCHQNCSTCGGTIENCLTCAPG